jgi:hypothetical protein
MKNKSTCLFSIFKSQTSSTSPNESHFKIRSLEIGDNSPREHDFFLSQLRIPLMDLDFIRDQILRLNKDNTVRGNSAYKRGHLTRHNNNPY